jgi:hypothetical protein
MKALLLVALTACVEPAPPIEPMVTSGANGMPLLQPYFSNQTDILFVIDSSPSIAAHLPRLDQALPAALRSLENTGGYLPDLQIGVVSANGDGRIGRILRDVPNLDGSRDRNYDGTLEAAFRADASLGAQSTAPSRPFEAARLALEPATNPGFVRGVGLVIVFVTATDDASPDSIDAYRAYFHDRLGDRDVAVIAITGTPAEAPRIHSVLEPFPQLGAAALITDDDLAPAFAIVDRLFRQTLAGRCWRATPIDVDAATPGLQRDCTATLALRDEPDTGIVILECGASPSAACWRIIDEPYCGGFGNATLSTVLEPAGIVVPMGTVGWIECVSAGDNGPDN